VAKLEANADDLKLVNVVKILPDTFFRHVGFGESNDEISSGTAAVDSSSEVALQIVLAIVLKDFYLCNCQHVPCL
jgi:hypothetical protein